MRIVIEPDAAAVHRRAAARIAALIRRRPACVLGLPTGRTPLALYRELERLHREEGLDFSSVVTFNLDEYVGLAPDHPESFSSYMRRNLFERVNIDPAHTHVPRGDAPDLAAECEAYERAIREAGGIDLQVLGIGVTGHIAFNEPGSSLGSRTRVKTLTRASLEAGAAHPGATPDRPRLAITMGVATILAARACLLLATGREKAATLRDAVEGPITAQVPATALQLHADVTVIIDEPAASGLVRREYYIEMEQAQRRLESGGR
ncbi:MAG: glucosamine-6-phosphate deaminase [Deltaproteobacteria bacterium]|nr:MAG: glucosamine-6-phosphate deaminase [Deltaproteobacteria bacterium]